MNIGWDDGTSWSLKVIEELWRIQRDTRYSWDEPAEESLLDKRIIYPSWKRVQRNIILVFDVSGASLSAQEIAEGISELILERNLEIVRVIFHDGDDFIEFDDAWDLQDEDFLKQSVFNKLGTEEKPKSFRKVYSRLGEILEEHGGITAIFHITDGKTQDDPDDLPDEVMEKIFYVFTDLSPNEKLFDYLHIFHKPGG